MAVIRLQNRRTLLGDHAKRKPLFLLALAICGVILSIFFRRSIVNALSLGFVQTDWSGGADTISTINSSNISGWTKYYSKTEGVTTSTVGEAKLSITITQP